MRFSSCLVGFVTAAVIGLSGCGGGGGSAGTTTVSGGAAASPVPSASSPLLITPVATNFIYQLDKNTLNNSGVDRIALTVTAVDGGNNPVAGVPIAVSLDSGIYTPTSAVTDAVGQASGFVAIGGNKTNRDIKAIFTVSGRSSVITIPVTGSQIALSLVPSTPAPGASVTLIVKVSDVNGSGISATQVRVSGTLGVSQTLNTDSTGNAVLQLGAAPVAPGTYSVDVVSSGIAVRRDIQVISAGGGGVPAVVDLITAASVAITPNNTAPNTVGSSTNRAGLRVVFQNSANQPIQNVRVRFEIKSPALDSLERLSTGSTVGGYATVYSDATGVAIADYIPGTRSSPTNGVVIRACYGNTDAEIALGACTNFKDATLTVASQPLSITLGDNNVLTKGANGLTYIKLFDIAVADSAGNAVANAQISASVDLKRYGKGTYTVRRPLCLNEDINRNGFVDAEDKDLIDDDGNDVLTPRKADVILSFFGANTTGSNGRATVQVEYPQNVATWLEYAVKVTTNVAGSEGTVEKIYRTDFVIGDDINGSFLTPPYGVNACNVPN